jgi:hypothetical protein
VGRRPACYESAVQIYKLGLRSWHQQPKLFGQSENRPRKCVHIVEVLVRRPRKIECEVIESPKPVSVAQTSNENDQPTENETQQGDNRFLDLDPARIISSK